MICIVPLVPMAGAAQAQEVTILALGDSLTAGYGLPQGDGLVPQLEAWLRARGADVAIVNAGVSGDTTQGGLNRVEWSLTPEVDAMIVTLGGNDILRGIDPAVTRRNLDGILDVADENGLPTLVIGLYASRNYGDDYKTAFEAIHPELAEEHGALYEPNFFQALGDGSGDPTSYRQWMQRDGIHPTRDGVARIVERIGPRVEELIGRVK